MFKRSKLVIFVVITYIIMSCNATTKDKQLGIGFSSDSSTILICGMSDKSLAYLKNNLVADTSYQQIVAVTQVIDEEDSVGREERFVGKLTMIGDTLVFKPVRSFIKGKNYLVQTVISSEFGSGADVITSSVGDHVKMQEQVLRR